MPRFLAFLFAIVVLLFFILFSESNQETHSLFYISGNDLYEAVKADGSFGSAPAFFLAEKIPQIKNRIVTGEYEIKKGDNALSVIQKMAEGKRITRKLTIPEGYTVKMILENLNANELLFGELPGNVPEASLAPNTYFYHFGDSKVSVLHKMQTQMNKVTAQLSSLNKTKLSFNEVLILASIIEKESGNTSELGLISSVFHNRLAVKMRLQSDPTVIYAITDGYGKMDRKLTRQDLWFKSPYNTYRNGGLPPSPICCPGEKAILAAMNPETTEYLYFVATKDHKSHTFSRDYKNHLNEVKKAKLSN